MITILYLSAILDPVYRSPIVTILPTHSDCWKSDAFVHTHAFLYNHTGHRYMHRWDIRYNSADGSSLTPVQHFNECLFIGIIIVLFDARVFGEGLFHVSSFIIIIATKIKNNSTANKWTDYLLHHASTNDSKVIRRMFL